MRLALLLLYGVSVLADVVTLKDGRQIRGQIESGATREIHIRVDNLSQAIAVDQIQSIQFDPPTKPQTVTLPVGTEIAVRTIERIDSKKADLYKEYAASLDDPVVVDGATLIPVNAKAVLRVSDLQQRKLKHSSLSLSLIAVTVSEQRVSVQTGSLDSQSGSKAKRTLAGAGIGGGAGAAIGAAAGGPVGAAIGAGAGAATGMIVAAATGKGVEIAPETRFTYKLTQPVVINEQTALPKVTPPIEPPVPPPEPGQISIGQSVADVIAALGQPSKIADVGTEKIYFFKDMKITFTDGKVSDVHLMEEKPVSPSGGGSVPEAQASAVVEPETIGDVYLQGEGGKLSELERVKPQKKYLTRTFGAPQERWAAKGGTSTVRVKSGQKTLFVVKLANGIDPASFTLLALEAKKGYRWIEPNPNHGPLKRAFNVTKFGESSYGLTPAEDLGDGEYAFVRKNLSDFYCFGVGEVGDARDR